MRLFSKYVFDSKAQVVAIFRRYCVERGVPASIEGVYAMLDDVLGDCYRLEFPKMSSEGWSTPVSKVLVSLSVLYETGEVMFSRQQWGVMGHGNMDAMIQGGIIKAEVNGFCLILSDLGALPEGYKFASEDFANFESRISGTEECPVATGWDEPQRIQEFLRRVST